MPKVLIADRHPLTRKGICAVLEGDARLRVGPLVDRVGGIQEAVEGTQPPDLILTEVLLRDGDTFGLIRDLGRTHPEIPVVVVTTFGEWFWVERSLRAGARAIVHKGDPAEYIQAAVEAALRGGLFVSPGFTERPATIPGARRAAGVLVLEERLTEREMEVFVLVGRGLSRDQIAGHLGLSPRSVDRHQEQIRIKCGFEDSMDMIRYAMLWMSHRAPEA